MIVLLRTTTFQVGETVMAMLAVKEGFLSTWVKRPLN